MVSPDHSKLGILSLFIWRLRPPSESSKDSEPQSFYLSYARKSQNVTPATFYWSPRANPDSVWKSLHLDMSVGKFG